MRKLDEQWIEEFDGRWLLGEREKIRWAYLPVISEIAKARGMV